MTITTHCLGDSSTAACRLDCLKSPGYASAPTVGTVRNTVHGEVVQSRYARFKRYPHTHLACLDIRLVRDRYLAFIIGNARILPTYSLCTPTYQARYLHHIPTVLHSMPCSGTLERLGTPWIEVSLSTLPTLPVLLRTSYRTALYRPAIPTTHAYQPIRNTTKVEPPRGDESG